MSISVLQTGTYNSMNKGDAAMELACAEQLQRHFDGAKVTISCPRPDIDTAFYAPLPVVSCPRRRLIYASVRLAGVLLWRALRDGLGVDARFLLAGKTLQAYRHAQVVVDLSGDMLTEDYGPHVAYSHYLPLLFAIAIGKPLFVCAQSIGPFKWTRPIARWMLNRAARITVRDEITLEYLRGIGVHDELLQLTADLAFLLEPVEDRTLEPILTSHGLASLLRAGNAAQKREKPVLGVSMSGLIASHFARRNPLARDGGIDWETMVASIVDKFAEEIDAEVVFFAHVTGPGESKDDRSAAQRVISRMQQPAYLLDGDCDPRVLKAAIARCDIFLGARMHANIAALSSAVPVVAIAYSHKAPGIMALFEQSDLVVDIETLDQAAIDVALRRAWLEREMRASTLRAAGRKVKAEAMQNFKVLREILERDEVSAAFKQSS